MGLPEQHLTTWRRRSTSSPELTGRERTRTGAIYKCRHMVAAAYGKTATFMPKPIRTRIGMHPYVAWAEQSALAGTAMPPLRDRRLLHRAADQPRKASTPHQPTTNRYKRGVPASRRRAAAIRAITAPLLRIHTGPAKRRSRASFFSGRSRQSLSRLFGLTHGGARRTRPIHPGRRWTRICTFARPRWSCADGAAR